MLKYGPTLKNATGRNNVHYVCGWRCSAIHKHYGHGFAIRAGFALWNKHSPLFWQMFTCDGLLPMFLFACGGLFLKCLLGCFSKCLALGFFLLSFIFLILRFLSFRKVFFCSDTMTPPPIGGMCVIFISSLPTH